jgi:dipeptidyl aminopeptidase/acylaminoacyl peptidase
MKSWRPELRALLLGALFLLLGLFAGGAARAAEPPPLASFFTRPGLQAARLSPDGRSLAFLATPGDARQTLYLLDLSEREARPRVLAQFDDADVARVDWVGSELLLFAVSDFRVPGARNARQGPGLFSVAREGGRPRELVQRRSQQAVEMRAGRRQSALDLRHVLLALPRGHGEDVLIGRWDEDGLHPLWLNARSGATRDAGMAAPAEQGEVLRWWFDGRGVPRVVLTQHAGRNRLHWRGADEADWCLLDERDPYESPWDVEFVDELGGLFVSVPRGAAGERVLTRYDFARKAPAQDALAALPGFDLMSAPLWDEGRLIGLRVEGEREHSVWLLPALRELQQQVDARFPGRVNRLDCRRCGADDAVLLLHSWSDRDPGQLWLLEQGGREWRALARVLPAVDPAQMAGLRLQRVVARDGLPLPVWITEPAGKGPWPTVMLVHGGPWVRGTRWQWDGMAQFLASRGYLVLQPEFRGSSGYGTRHWKAGLRQWGQAMQDDLADVLRWAQRQGLAGDKACIAGASYGGYATLMGLARQAELWRCGVAWVAVADLELFLEGGWFVDDDIPDAARRLGLPRLVGDLKTEREALRQVSPVHLAEAIARRPLLLAHGEKDRRVPLAHAERLREALSAAGRAPEWVLYPGEGHGWHLQAHREDWARRVEDFLARQLK